MSETGRQSRRILIVDDELPVLDAYQQILQQELGHTDYDEEVDALGAELFGDRPSNPRSDFDLTLCEQGAAAVDSVRQAVAEGKPFAVGFLDVRMPPGMNGVETGALIRALDPDMQIVFVTAYSDFEPDEIVDSVPPAEHMFYVQKPLRPQELRQFATALCSRWHAEHELQTHASQLVQANERMRAEIRERERAQDALNEQVALHEAISRTVPSSLFVLDSALRVLASNDRPVFGEACDPAQPGGCSLEDAWPAAVGHQATLTERIRAIAAHGGDEEFVDLAVRDGDGPERYLDVHLASFPGCGGDELGRVLMVVDDVTERRRLEERVHEAARLESLGRLAGGIAHDFNNLLAAIRGFAQLGQVQAAESHPLSGYLDSIESAAIRGADLTKQMLAFARKQPMAMSLVEPNALITDLSRMVGRLIGEHVELRLDLAEGVGAVWADKRQLEQILLNLCVNGRDAMKHGGTLEVRTAQIEVSPQDAHLSTGGEPGVYVAISVRDTGEGMDAATRALIFEPFFTTKEVGKGTGLGLAVAYSTVRQFGGQIEVASQPGEGSTFTILLPWREPPTEVSETVPVTVAGEYRGSEAILVVEDEGAVRYAVAEMLRHLGYEVKTASSAEEVEQMAARGEVAPDLLLTDIVMPGKSGVDLYEALSGVMPDLKALYMSGYADEVSKRLQGMPLEYIYLQKPFSHAELGRKVRELLDRKE